MSYDRYLAICNPLHYTSFMDLRLRIHLVLWSWLLTCMIALLLVILIHNLKFCGSSIIDHYCCDLVPLLELSCSDTTFVKLVDYVFAIIFSLLPFFFILFTYLSISITIFGVSSTGGKQKAFSTCSSHLIVVSTFYGTLITIYMVPSKGQLFNVNKVMSLLYTMGTPLFNPIIYSFRNQEMKRALIKYITNISTTK
ncbi:olfactory receptor 1E16-like [Pelodytes ibericus]